MSRSEMTDDAGERVFTVAEASRRLQLREARIRRAIRDGELQAARIGRLFRIRQTDLEDFFESRLVGKR